MIASNKDSNCSQALIYYYDYLRDKHSPDIPQEIVEHINECDCCSEEIQKLSTQLILDEKVSVIFSETKDFSIVNALKRQFAYSGQAVTCNTTKPFLATLVNPSIVTRIPTPITVHVDQCRQCREDAEKIRRATLTNKQLMHLGELFDESTTQCKGNCKKSRQHINSIAEMEFEGISSEILQHVCMCPDCREALYDARQSLIVSLHGKPVDSNIPCNAISDTDIFDYVVPYGIDPNNDEYAKFRKSLASHLANCTTCSEKMQTLHENIYGIAERQESGVSTCVTLDNDFKESVKGESDDVYSDWPLQVQVHDTSSDQNFSKENVNEFKTNTYKITTLKNLKKFAKPLAAAAAILLVGMLLFNTSVAEAIDLKEVCKALRLARNVHTATYVPGKMVPISERWVSRESQMMMFKSESSCVLWDIGNESMNSKDAGQTTVETKNIEKTALAKLEKLMEVPVGVSPFDNANAIPKNAVWQEVSDISGKSLNEGIVACDLTWSNKNGSGIDVYDRCRFYIEVETKLLWKMESWQRMGNAEYELTNFIEFDYPSDIDIATKIKEAGF
jgi:hypothetical protein